MATNRRKTGRPPAPVIDYDQAIDAALEIIDEGGMEQLSMRKLASRLGINASSLYHHFKNKDEILESVALKIAESAPAEKAKSADRWEEALLDLAKSYRRILVKHPNATYLASKTHIRDKKHDDYERILENLQLAGFTAKEALLYMSTLEVLAVGSAIIETTSGNTIDFGEVDQSKHPILAKAVAGSGFEYRETFEQMCHLLLTGPQNLPETK